MKKKLLLLSVLIPILFVSCGTGTQNEPTNEQKVDSTKLHQPTDPATWSPIGKTYVGINDKGDNWCVFVFFSEDSLEHWETPNYDDLFDRDKSPNYEKFGYYCEYPNFYYTHHEVQFNDTISFRIWDYNMLLFR